MTDEKTTTDGTEATSEAEVIAQRSPDIEAEAANEHVKVFVIEPGPKPTEENGYSHEANIAAARQYMISQGLRPDGEARVVSVEPYGPGDLSWAITYAIPAVPTENADPNAEVHIVEPPKTTAAATKAAEKPKAKAAPKAKAKAAPKAKAAAKPKASPKTTPAPAPATKPTA